MTCKQCKGHLTHNDEYGMWCDKECGRDASVSFSVEDLVSNIFKVIKGIEK